MEKDNIVFLELGKDLYQLVAEQAYIQEYESVEAFIMKLLVDGLVENYVIQGYKDESGQ